MKSGGDRIQDVVGGVSRAEQHEAILSRRLLDQVVDQRRHLVGQLQQVARGVDANGIAKHADKQQQ